ncbi:zinc finger protein 501-like [Dermacentor silvarum]|uniref:zinc finger protein 501-like n=1 Tax=Dermacentor silvarum TaxID=543639 RepID=UPI0021007A58|nr:zinc finger protein 501-like [Dermacentor silvarum]
MGYEDIGSTSIVIKSEPQDVAGEQRCEDDVVASHLTGSSQDTEGSQEADLPHRCELCHQLFNTPQRLLQHSVVHSRQLPFWCAHCGAAFASPEDKAEHESSHVDKRQYRCVLCYKLCSHEPMLREHMRIHYGQPGFHCHLCPLVCVV